MNRELVVRRLASVEDTCGSIVGTATWCTLHAQQAPLILSVLSERLADSSVVPRSKVALLYVVHEMLLSCVANATSDGGKRSIVGAVLNSIPNGIRSASATGDKDLAATVRKLVGWWSTLKLFPESWIGQLNETVAPATAADQLPAAPTSAGASASERIADIPEELVGLSKLLLSYKAAKAALARQPSDATRDEAARLLNDVVRSLNDTTNRISTHERMQLFPDERAAVGGEIEEGNGSARTGAQRGQEATMSAADDVLGSFF